MPFPQTVREAALIECGRHCCVCHRFTGTKIECHHIVPESEGGDNTLSNCIPLCFDCHAHVQHYNPHHPKGTKFQAGELRAHRDNWNNRVSLTTPPIFDKERRAVDRKLFDKLKIEIPENLARELLNNHCWGNPINSETLDKIYSIDRLLERLDSEFLDPTCEGYRSEFRQAYRAFWNTWEFGQISPHDRNPDLYCLPKNWIQSNDPAIRQQFSDCMDKLNELSTIAYESYEKMVREIRRLLIVQ